MSTPLLTDSGLETWRVFHPGVDLPDFAAFPLLANVDDRTLLAEYFRDHLRIAAKANNALVLETPTWRANPDWGARLGYDALPFSGNRDAVALLRQLGQEFDGVELIVSGNLGPRGDGYRADELLTPADAAAYHRTQIDSFAAAGADRVTMLTATHAGEAIGVVQAAVASEIPVVIAFTVETDGRLATGQPLHKGDHRSGCGHRRRSASPRRQLCHPDHFGEALGADPVAIGRIALHRPERPGRTHAELDEAEELDDGDPAELANLYARLRDEHPHLQVLGGRCGTDSHHGHRSGLRDNRRCVARENRRWATDPNTGATD